MKKLMKFALVAAVMAPAFSALAEDTAISTFITSTQTTITGYITLLVAALLAVIGAALTLRAIPYIYRRVCSFFSVAK